MPPVEFTSKTLCAAEQKYAAYEIELLAIIDTIRSQRSYLHGTKFIVFP